MKEIILLIQVDSGEEYDLVQEKICTITPEPRRLHWRGQDPNRQKSFVRGSYVIRFSPTRPIYGSHVSQDRRGYYLDSREWKRFKLYEITAKEFLQDEWNDPRGFL